MKPPQQKKQESSTTFWGHTPDRNLQNKCQVEQAKVQWTLVFAFAFEDAVLPNRKIEPGHDCSRVSCKLCELLWRHEVWPHAKEENHCVVTPMQLRRFLDQICSPARKRNCLQLQVSFWQLPSPGNVCEKTRLWDQRPVLLQEPPGKEPPQVPLRWPARC